MIVMNKKERANLDNTVLDNLDIEEILESPEEPILTLNFKCNSDDYRSSQEMWSGRFNIVSTRRIRVRAFFLILFCVFIALFASPYGINYSKYYHFVILATIISIITISINIYIVYCCKRKYTYILHILTGIHIRSFSNVYENRTRREIKKIILPCEFKFYDTYFIKTIPTPEVMYKTTAEKIVDLPLTTLWPPVDYSAIGEIYENKKTITFFQRIFIPKDQLSENEKQKLDLILNKICAQNNIIR